MKRLFPHLHVAVVTAAVALAAPGFAQAPGRPGGVAQSEVDRAVSLAHEGRSLYDSGQFGPALERFRAADRIAHSPVLSLYVARCERNLTHLVAARDAYRVVVGEVLPSDAPAPFITAKADAERELAALEPRIPRVKVEIPGSTGGTRVQLDGVVVEPTARGPLWVDPGDHVLSRSDGAEPVTRSFRAVEGAATLVVELAAPSATATSASSTPSEARAPGDGDRGGTIVPGLVVLGVGVVGLGVGVATGLVASSKTSDIEDNCVDGHCLASDAANGDAAGTFATASTVSFIVGGVATAAGVVLLITLGSDDDGATAMRRERIEIAPTAGGAQGIWVF